ncbi:choline kinase [Sphingomonas vulcanisoli]|uniref:Choline kinase n=1 Tax=Sphingomonas vulcanisoli TaxID=1658060 RepID=A0ABX0TSW8_9SPHN|nr:sugar phosphate nucleotidyltransferase [Sphingomonas vulcanisoli]NIJ08608.1 choline kinase [Sphingomonas vulcanisoli]
MRAIILAAGQGTRLLPFTRQHPKCLVPVGGKAILDHQLEALAANGITDVLVIGGYRIDRLEQHLSHKPANQRPGLLLNPFWPVANSISSVWTARHQLHEPFCLLNGDTLFSADLIAAALDHAGDGINLLVERTEDFMLDDMLVAVEGERVRAVGKTLAEGVAAHRSMGFIIAKGIGPILYVEALDEVIGAEGGHGRFHHAIIDRLAWDSAVRAIEGDGSSALEIDRPEDIERWQAK